MGISWAAALQVHVAPISYINEQEPEVITHPYIQEDLLRELHGYELGLVLRFSPLTDLAIRSPQSTLDAIKVCRAEKAEYLLYGYVASKEYTITAEIKLFEYESRSVIQFFYAVDDPEHYKRMIQDLAGKIMEYLDTAMHLVALQPQIAYSHIIIPASLGYWTPINGDWTDLILGTFTVTGGMRFIPNDRLFTAWGKVWYLSLGVDLSYKFGIGNPNAYKAYYHEVTATSPVRLHLKLDEQQRLSFGLGPVYAFSILNIQEPYKDMETNLYSSLGFMASFGYEFQLSDRIALFFDNQFEMQFYQTSMALYTPRIGIQYAYWKKEVVKKW
jgi:hypothetical protein